MPRVGARLWQRQAQNPVSPANTTRPRDTSGSRNWHLHRSEHAHRKKYWFQRHHGTFRALIQANVTLTATWCSQFKCCKHKRLNLVQTFLQFYATCSTGIRVNVLRVDSHVRTMSSPLLWFPGSLYLGVNCWVTVKLRHSNDILASERSCLIPDLRVSTALANVPQVTDISTQLISNAFLDLCMFVGNVWSVDLLVAPNLARWSRSLCRDAKLK